MATFEIISGKEYIESLRNNDQPLVLPITGAQWGDESKGAATSLLAPLFSVIVRAAGGRNAGHTVYYGGKKYALHQLPSGLFAAKEGERSVALAGGMVIDPYHLIHHEMSPLESEGFTFDKTLVIDAGAQVILPHAILEELIKEEFLGIGTTMVGIGPTYEHKAGRDGIRIEDLTNPSRLKKLVEARDAHLERFLRGHATSTLEKTMAQLREKIDGHDRFDDEDFRSYLKLPLGEKAEHDQLVARLLAFGDRLGKLTRNVPEYLLEKHEEGRDILVEGAQGFFLDLDHGFYPMVTSSNASSLGMPAQIGLPPHLFSRPLSAAKWYMTKVGGGEFPTAYLNNSLLSEQNYKRENALSEREVLCKLATASPEDVVSIDCALRDFTDNYGTSTGRPRMGGRFDAVLTGMAARRTGADIFLAMLDTIPINPDDRYAVGYRREGISLTPATFPRNNDQLRGVEPVYAHLGEYKLTENDLAAVDQGKITRRMNGFLTLISDEMGVPISGIRYGAKEDEVVMLRRTD